MTITGRIALLIIAAALVAIYAVYLWPRVDRKFFDARMNVRGWWTRAVAELRGRRAYGPLYGKRAR